MFSVRQDPTYDVQKQFQKHLPRIEVIARFTFRHLTCVHRKDDAVAECLALSWSWWSRLVQRGKDPTRFVSALASLAARAVRSHRRLCGQEKAQDAMSPLAQQRHQFRVERYSDKSMFTSNAWQEALHDNMQTPVPDQVSFRQDFPAWLSTRTIREQKIIRELIRGNHTRELAKKFGLSPARLGQLRNEFQEDWELFINLPVD